MKITSVECYLGDGSIGGYVTMKVNTDEGIYGWGEAGLAYGDCQRAAWGQCQDFAKRIIGMDPFNIEEIWEHLHRHTFWGMGGGVVVTSAMAAIDIALWDIKGKALGVPVYQLLGGKTNKKLRAYASQLQLGWRKDIEANDRLCALSDPEDYYRVVKEAMEEGYDAVKIDPLQINPNSSFAEMARTAGTHHRGCIRQDKLELGYERMAAAREAGGKDLDIIVEIHSLLDANTAAAFGRALEPLNIMYYEEPTSPENPGNFKYIKDRCRLPLATGERSFTRWGFVQFFEDHTLEVVQPDLANTGGITETKKICDMAQVYDMGAQIHICGGPIATAAALHVEAVIPNFVIHEEHNGNLTSAFVKGGVNYYAPKNGYYEVPELPGIGNEMSEEYIKSAQVVIIK